MKHMPPFVAGVLILLAPVLVFAQSSQPPEPASPSDFLDDDLIIWSQQHEPQPVPQPLPASPEPNQSHPTLPSDPQVQPQQPVLHSPSHFTTVQD